MLEEDRDCVLDLFCRDDLWGLGFRGAGFFVGLPSSGSASLAILFAFDLLAGDFRNQCRPNIIYGAF